MQFLQSVTRILIKKMYSLPKQTTEEVLMCVVFSFFRFFSFSDILLHLGNNGLTHDHPLLVVDVDDNFYLTMYFRATKYRGKNAQNFKLRQ